MIFFSTELKWSIRELEESQDKPKETEKFLPHFKSQNLDDIFTFQFWVAEIERLHLLDKVKAHMITGTK